MREPTSPTLLNKFTPKEKEKFHHEAESRIQIFSYSNPGKDQVRNIGDKKLIARLAKGEFIRLHVQTVKEGGENNLHYHTGSETIWMVLKGRTKFYGPGDEVLGELGPLDGILIPGGARYWFEKAGDGDLEIMQIVAYDSRSTAQEQRLNVENHKDWMDAKHLQIYEKS